MDTKDIGPLLEDLTSNIDDLEGALAPLLEASLRDTCSKLPLLDKAKLNVLATYAIESIIFSYLNLSAEDAKAHPVFKELARVKQYFAKIKTTEEGEPEPPERPGNRSLDKAAANRFIKHGLAGNERYDKDRAETQKREKANAKIKFDQLSEQIEMERLEKKRKAEKDAARGSDSSSESSESDESEDEEESREQARNKNVKPSKSSKESQAKGNPGSRSAQKRKRDKSTRPEKSSKVPKGASEAFQALLNRPGSPKNYTSPEQKEKQKGKKSKKAKISR